MRDLLKFKTLTPIDRNTFSVNAHRSLPLRLAIMPYSFTKITRDYKPIFILNRKISLC